MHYVLPGSTVERTAQKLKNCIAYLSNGFLWERPVMFASEVFENSTPLRESLGFFFFFLGGYAQVAIDQLIVVPSHENITIEFMFAGINMFWARLRLILARAARRGLK